MASDEKCDQAGYFLKSYTETESFLSRRTLCELSDFHCCQKMQTTPQDILSCVHVGNYVRLRSLKHWVNSHDEGKN